MASTILCVDDDRHLCRILEKALSGAGYRVVTAHDGDDALRLMGDASPDLAILDVLLPRRDGFEVLAKWREMEPPHGDLPVLLTTGGRVTPQYQRRADSLGAAALLAKPVPLQELLEQVKRHLKPGPPAARGRRKAPRTVVRPKRSAGKSLSGTFRELAFSHLLHQLHGLRATGVLLLDSGKRRKAVQMRDGYPVAVKSNLVNECLGNLLMRRGVLTAGELEESLRRLKKGEGLQGQILVAMELVTEEWIASALREQAEEKLFEIFSWRRGRFRFEIGSRLKRGNELALDDSPANLILRGIRGHVPLDRVDHYLRDRAERFVTRGESPFYRFQEIDLAPGEAAVLGELDGTRKLGEFLDADEGVRRALYGLLATEMLDLRRDETPPLGTDAVAATELRDESSLASEAPSPPDPERDRALRAELAATAAKLRGQSYYEMLGVGRAVDAEAVDRAYEALARRSHPDRYSAASSAVRQLADEVHQLVSRAHETLTDPKRRREYELERRKGERKAAERRQGQRALDAEIEFQKGEALLRGRDYERALAHFGTALSKYPEEGEYYAHYGWCLHLCHPDDVGIIQEAIEHVRRGVKLARDREKPYLYLGRLYKAVGKGAVAERMFTRAVQIRPECVEALRELRLINLRRNKGGLGLVRRIFRR
ncbi:MAG: response regulator [Proteobacteria bacterium]|nr:response regulator [Pseudomonadota bacterium]